MKAQTYDHIEEMMGTEAAGELLDQEPALKDIVDYDAGNITGEVKIGSEGQMIMKMSEMGHWRITSISTIPDGRVFFTAQCINLSRQ